jgi:hypothetical protein
MSLLSKLQAKGVKVYSGSPLWEKSETLGTVELNDNIVVVENSGDYGGYSLVIEEDSGRVYIPLKSGVSHEKDTYSIVEFRATRDWVDYKIVEGSTKIFAV